LSFERPQPARPVGLQLTTHNSESVKKSAAKSNHKGHKGHKEGKVFFVLFVSFVVCTASKYPISSQAKPLPNSL
jgi:hypothetical protein